MSITKINKLLAGDVRSYGTWGDLAILLLRLYVGITMASVGLDKLPLPDWMVDQVSSVGFPFPTFFAWLACFSEFGLGILLSLGLLTRMSSFFIAITMAVASFMFQGVLPIIDMHIAQHYVWSCLLFMAMGPGRWSVDYLVSQKSKNGENIYSYLSLAGLFVLLSISGYIEMTGTPNPGDTSESVEISSVNIPGSFNNWDPSAIDMMTENESDYYYEISFPASGLQEFKFTINRSWDTNFGEADQSSQGFPVKGIVELDKGSDTDNIKVFIPETGRYRFDLNKNTFEYSVRRVEE